MSLFRAFLLFSTLLHSFLFFFSRFVRSLSHSLDLHPTLFPQPQSAKLTAATTQHAVALQLAPLLFASAKSLPQESLRNAAACLAASLGGPGREDTLRYLQAWEGLPRDVREAVASRASEVETGIVASSIANRARAVAMLRDVLAVGKGIEDPEVLLAYRLS